MITFGLIGHPLCHSFSQAFFTEKFSREGIDARYLNFDIEQAPEVIDILKDDDTLAGFNVTIPHKVSIIRLLDFVSDGAKAIGAVNVVKVTRKNNQISLAGYNTDVIGFRNSLLPHLNKEITNALILGTGGASKAVSYALESLGIDAKFVSRTKKENTLTYSELDADIIHQHKLIVNTTPLGTWPDTESCPPIPYDAITANHICFDLVYNPPQTTFMSCAAQMGAKTINGLEMLHLQAEAAWHIWNAND